MELPGFASIEHKDRRGEAYGGVGLYVRQNIHYERRTDLESDNLEILWTVVWTKTGKLLIGVCYRPPSALINYWDKLAENIERAMAMDLPILIMGDLNCNTLVRPNKLEEITVNLGLRTLNDQPTHYTDHSATCIDVAITSSPTRISSVFTTAPGISNHSALIVNLDCPVEHGKSYKKKVPLYKKTNWEKVNDQLNTATWPSVESELSLDEIVESWSLKFQQIVEQNTPTRTVRVEPWSKAWYSKEVKRARKRRDTEGRRMRRCNLPKGDPASNKKITRRSQITG